MKRLVALFTVFALVASPALAGITPLSGTTNGNLATGSQGSGVGTTLTTGTTTVAAPANTLFVVSVFQRNLATITKCYDSVNTSAVAYNLAGSVVTSGTSNAWTYYFYSTSAVGIGSTFSCDFPSTANAKSMVVTAFTGAATSAQLDAVTTGTGTWVAATPFTIGPTGTLACNTSAGEVLVATTGFSALQTTLTEGSGFSTVADIVTNNQGHAAYQIVNANTAVSYSPTSSATAANYGGEIVGFKAATCGAAAIKHGLLLTGVGQ